MNNEIILVDDNDNETGNLDKLEVHRKGLLHRAFSIFIFNSKNELLIQKRAKDKYHSSGLWSNSCCSHPYFGENTLDACKRRLLEEMGFICDLKKIFSFNYKINFNNGLIENELDYVFKGFYDGNVDINENEVCDYKWIDIEELIKDIDKNSKKYTYWFKLIIKDYFDDIID